MDPLQGQRFQIHTLAFIKQYVQQQCCLARTADTTKIIIAQRISSVQDADKIIVLNEGRVENIGTHEELLKSSPIYRDVYESQTTKSQSTEEGGVVRE